LDGEVLNRVLSGELAHLDGRVVYRLRGELDSGAATAFRDRIAHLVSSSSGSGVVLDLSELTFIDSAGMRSLLQLHEQAQAGGCTLVLLRPQRQVSSVLDLLGLTDLFTIEP
jgi:anti-sigma B factor antagonist